MGLGTFFIWIIYFTKRCMVSPEAPSNMMCCPTARNKFIPPIFALLLVIMGGRIDVLVGFVLAEIQCMFFNGSFLRVSPAMVLAI